MTRPPNRPYHKANCTPAQKEAVKQALNNALMMPEYKIKNEAQLIRLGIDMVCEAFGVKYPHDLIERGKYDRASIDWGRLAKE